MRDYFLDAKLQNSGGISRIVDLTNYGKKKQTRTVKILKIHRTGRFDRKHPLPPTVNEAAKGLSKTG